MSTKLRPWLIATVTVLAALVALAFTSQNRSAKFHAPTIVEGESQTSLPAVPMTLSPEALPAAEWQYRYDWQAKYPAFCHLFPPSGYDLAILNTLWHHHMQPASHKIMIAHVAWKTTPSRFQTVLARFLPMTRYDTWHEALILLPPGCIDPQPVKRGRGRYFPVEPVERDTCMFTKDFYLADVNDYALPGSLRRPQDHRKITDVDFSPDERDLLFTLDNRHYRMRLPVWKSK